MTRIGTLVCALMFLAGTAFADPFTGRYEFESNPAIGANLSGYVDIAGAPMGTTTFKLGDSFVTGFSMVISGPGISTLTYDSLANAVTDNLITFDVALGGAVLTPTASSPQASWWGIGDRDGQGDLSDQIVARTSATQVVWFGIEDQAIVRITGTNHGASPAAWRLVLDPSSVPEPGTLVLLALAAGGVLIGRRRRRV